MKKKKPEEPQPREAPKFRPLEAQLKALAKEARDREAALAKERETAQTHATAQSRDREGAGKPKPAIPPPARASTPAVPETKPREATLTKQEREELEALDRSHNDEFYFRRMMGGIQPLGDDKRGRVTIAPKLPKRDVKPEPIKDPDDDVRDHLMNLVEGGARFEISDDGRHIEGKRLDLADATFRRLRRGELPIDARLDLHGKRADEARDALERFLKEKRARRDRVVLVIHGRGDHSPAGIGVLRGEIGAWLAQGRASQHVAAFATAHGEDGGEGALYVLLRP